MFVVHVFYMYNVHVLHVHYSYRPTPVVPCAHSVAQQADSPGCRPTGRPAPTTLQHPYRPGQLPHRKNQITPTPVVPCAHSVAQQADSPGCRPTGRPAPTTLQHPYRPGQLPHRKNQILLLPSFHAPTPSPNKLTAPDAGLLAARPLLPYSIRIGQDSSRTGKIKLLLQAHSRRSMRPLRRPTSWQPRMPAYWPPGPYYPTASV